MIPNVNFNPNFANLAALRGLGGMPNPVSPIRYSPAPAPMPGHPVGFPNPVGPERFTTAAPTPGHPVPFPNPVGPGRFTPASGTFGMPPMNNLLALRQLLGQGGGFIG